MSSRAPAFGPALLLIGGAIAARQLGVTGLWLVIGALLLAGALARRLRLLAPAAALGWLVGAFEPTSEAPLQALQLDRPVEVRAELAAPWKVVEGGWRARLAVVSITQGELVITRSPRLGVFLAGEQRPPPGSRVALRGYLRPPRVFRNGPSRRSGEWRISVSSRRLVAIEAAGVGDQLSAWSQRVRDRVEHRLERRAGCGSSLARALILGDTSALPVRQLVALRRLGLGHLVAVSGLHLGLLSGAAWACSWPLGYRGRLAVVTLVVLFYLGLVGPRPALLRSSLMALTALVSVATERRPVALNCWALAVAGMVVWDATLVAELAFQLTAAATLGLIVLTPTLRRWLWPRDGFAPLSTALAASIAAHVATLPWSVAVFHLWSPGSIALNVVAVSWTALTLPVAVLAVALEPVAHLGDLVWRLFAALAAPYEWLTGLPPGPAWSLAVSRPFAGVAALSVALGLAIVQRRGRTVMVLFVIACLYLSPLASPTVDGVEIIVLDVGQGEAILVRDGRRALLVDGGGWRGTGIGQRVLLPALLQMGLSRLEGVVLSHPDRDHCAGLVELASLIPVQRVWTAPGWPDRCYSHLIRLPGVSLSPLWSGRRFAVGRWAFEVLHPSPGERLPGNEGSLVLHAVTGSFGVLLTGDIGLGVERRLVDRSAAKLAATVLKVGHHGSRGSSGAPFLERVAPQVALISAGRDNVYGHPTAEVLSRLESRHVAVWRTDQGGQIRLRFGPDHLSVDQPWHPGGASPVYNSPHGAPRRHRRSDRDR